MYLWSEPDHAKVHKNTQDRFEASYVEKKPSSSRKMSTEQIANHKIAETKPALV